MKFLLTIAAMLCLVRGEDVRTAFQKAMAKYSAKNLAESPDTRKARFSSFVQFHTRVEEINNDKTRPFTAEDNFFSILTPEERQRYLGLNVTGLLKKSSEITNVEVKTNRANTDVPKQRDFGLVISDIKQQGECGSCWTFAATAALEGEIYFTTGTKKVSLSEQEYVECATKRNGCMGGFSDDCYTYSKIKDRIAPTSDYPYTGKDSRKCKAARKANALKDNHVKVVGDLFTKGNAALLQQASEHIVAVAVYVNNDFEAYSEGIYTDEKCQKEPNHEVAVVGYGVMNGKQYWKVRNSWGQEWGQKGYIFMDREEEDLCMIASFAHIPQLECRKGETCSAPNPDEGDSSEGKDDDEDKEDEDDHEDEDEDEGDEKNGDVCYETLSLSSCKTSREDALAVCQLSSLPVDKWIIVKNKGCYRCSTDKKVKSKDMTVEYTYSCKEH